MACTHLLSGTPRAGAGGGESSGAKSKEGWERSEAVLLSGGAVAQRQACAIEVCLCVGGRI